MSRIAYFIGLAGLLCTAMQAQDLEPRRYAALPKDMHAVVVLYGLSRGNIVSDAALPISDFKMTMHNVGLGYMRTFGIAGKLARVSVSVPFTSISGDVTFRGRDTSGKRTGFNDAQVRVGINLTGSPAQDKRSFTRYQQRTIFGVSMVFNLPTGLYHNDLLINTGTNRWGFKPEVGFSQRFKRVYLEVYSGVWFYTLNDEYLGHRVLKQRPIFSVQGHACYGFKNLMWVSIDGTWFNGGQTIVDGREVGDLFDNWRVGGTWSTPLGKGHSLKFQFHIGAFATRGYDYNTVSLAYQYVFF